MMTDKKTATVNRNTNIYVNTDASASNNHTSRAANGAAPNHSLSSTFQADSATMGYEDALDYTVNASTGGLKPGDKRTVNYLVHRMIWDQQEKIDVDDRAISKDGTMEVQDKFEIPQSGTNKK